MRYKAVVFDFDYTLGDATEAIYAGFCHAFREMGLQEADRETVRRTVGMLVVDAYTAITGDDDPANRDRFYRLFHPVAKELQAQGRVELLPGAAELLDALRDRGVPAAVVSTKNDESLRVVLEAKGILDRFAWVVGGNTVTRHKPDPEGVSWVLDRLGIPPGEALYCGDTVIDAETAQRAGTDFCAVLNGTTPGEAFAPWPRAHVAPDLYDLKDWLEEGGTL